MPEHHWGRLNDGENRGLRRGAWYRVLDLTGDDAVLEVQRHRVPVPRSSVTIVGQPPKAWTVVPRPPDARRLPLGWGLLYGVCPSCRTRVPVRTSPHSMRCPRCHGQFRVGWEEWFLKPAR